MFKYEREYKELLVKVYQTDDGNWKASIYYKGIDVAHTIEPYLEANRPFALAWVHAEDNYKSLVARGEVVIAERLAEENAAISNLPM